MDEKQARHLEVHTKWNGKANVCVHCGRVPETFYTVTGHDHTGYGIRWCPCREPNHNWCAGCSPDNCSGCGAGPGAYTTPQPDRVTELEAALKVAREALANCAADYLHADSVLTDSALAKINEVLK